jgi:hypothetical protein
VVTVAPAETLTKRLYSASAIAWSLALFGIALLSAAAIRQLVSPMRIVGVSSAARWLTLMRWCLAIAEGRLFGGAVRRVARNRDARAVAQAAAAAIAAHALPSPDPPPLTALAFFGAARTA